MTWVAAQRRGRSATLDARLASGAGTAPAHASDLATTSGDWNWPAHRAACGVRIKAGDDLDVIGFRVTADPPPGACKRCLKKTRTRSA